MNPLTDKLVLITGASYGLGEVFARQLLDEAGLSTIPGRGFGPSAATYVRVSLTHPIEVLEDVFDRMARIAG